MGHDEALETVLAAARKWWDELGLYVIPDAADADLEGYQHEYDALGEALIVMSEAKAANG